MVKVGWSKKGRKEYEHKASRAVVHIVAGAVAQSARSGCMFASESFLPVIDPQNKREVPAYQA
ncbi:MAG: hypothetical protein ABIF82_07760, partial [Planctomycetota bacterium]